MANKYFYPPLEPFATGELIVDEPHRLYWEQCGNPQGEPVLFLHGGPGAGCTEFDRRFFDPEHFRIVLFDQRGCGRSSPVGVLSNNSMADTTRDIEQLRESLGIERWHVFGGSYGSTISLYYSQQHPQRCKSLVLRGIWMLRNEEIDWWLNRVGFIQPELWKIFAEFIPTEERHDLLEAYWRRLTGDDQQLALEAAKHWAVYEGSCCTLLPNPEFSEKFAEEQTAWAVARLEAHYFRNVRLEPDTQLLANVSRIRAIPAFAVHGRYDIVCPVKSLLDLAAAWPELDWEIAPKSGHSSHEAEITQALVAATQRIMQTGRPDRV
ncbi:MAG: prolyl aminopeptidase [Xanthomonadales bacterium]|nr:prolyl aminopeptidase [Xanthomonadales bacterium]